MPQQKLPKFIKQTGPPLLFSIAATLHVPTQLNLYPKQTDFSLCSAAYASLRPLLRPARSPQSPFLLTNPSILTLSNIIIIIRIRKFSMLAIKAMFGLTDHSSPQTILAEHLAFIAVNNSQPLPPHYHLPQTGHAPSQNQQVFGQLVRGFESASSLSGIFKMLTVLIKTLRQSSYKSEYMEVLWQMQIPEMVKAEKDNQWAYEIVIAVKSYLLRLPSISDILRIVLEPTFQISANTDNCLDNLFRLINVFGLLFPNINNGINTVGRYYMKTHPFMSQFYYVLKEEILLGYTYIERIVKRFIHGYSDCGLKSLQCFMSVTPEIELYCDKAEEFIMNKYFKGKTLSNKIYLKEDVIQEISYFLGEKAAEGENKARRQEDSSWS